MRFLSQLPWYWPYAFVSFFLVLMPLGMVGVHKLEEQPAFCLSCHEMERYGETWLSSGLAAKHHDCLQCHSGPGIPGAIGAQVQGAKELWAHLTDNIPRRIDAEVPDTWCTKCHNPRDMGRTNEEIHAGKIVTTGRHCAECHKHN
jgi:nitrate/TMAO reductase-like tetraheme cytochrome c subunit